MIVYYRKRTRILDEHLFDYCRFLEMNYVLEWTKKFLVSQQNFNKIRSHGKIK